MTLYIIFRNNEGGYGKSLIPAPKLPKEFWPHTIMLLIPLALRVIFLIYLFFLGAKGWTFGSADTVPFMKGLTLFTAGTAVAMIVLMVINDTELRKNGVVYAWTLCQTAYMTV